MTNPEILKRGIADKVANALLVKLNQIGTVTETLDAVAWRATPATRRSSRTAPARPKTRPSPTWRSAPRRADQDRIGQPHRSHLQVQPAAAHRRGAGIVGDVRRDAAAGARKRASGDRDIRRPGRPAEQHAQVVLLRHGESTWNKENRFTGWTRRRSVRTRARRGARGRPPAARRGYVFDVAFTSVLKRAIKTLGIALDELDQLWIPVTKSWRLNERHYGALQGLNKAETAAKHGEAQVKSGAAATTFRRRR